MHVGFLCLDRSEGQLPPFSQPGKAPRRSRFRSRTGGLFGKLRHRRVPNTSQLPHSLEANSDPELLQHRGPVRDEAGFVACRGSMATPIPQMRKLSQERLSHGAALKGDSGAGTENPALSNCSAHGYSSRMAF